MCEGGPRAAAFVQLLGFGRELNPCISMLSPRASFKASSYQCACPSEAHPDARNRKTRIAHRRHMAPSPQSPGLFPPSRAIPVSLSGGKDKIVTGKCGKDGVIGQVWNVDLEGNFFLARKPGGHECSADTQD